MRLLPESISSFGSAIDSLLLLITVLVGIGLLSAEAVLIYSAIRFRKRPGARAAHIVGNTWRQLRWIVVPVVVVVLGDAFIDVRTHEVWESVKGGLPQPDRVVGITGQQFQYTFTYPGPDGVLGTDDDFQKPSELHVPVDESVVFDLQAKDVLHSFFVPALRLKQDAVPGRTIKGWFKATTPGTYEISCAEICGTGHTVMRATLFVHTREDYQRWLAESVEAAAGAKELPLLTGAAAEGQELVRAKGCLGCHRLDGTQTVAPTYRGLFGRHEVVATQGKEREILVDEAYLRRSMLEPQSDVVKGYQPLMPPQRSVLSDQEIAAVIEYLKQVK